MKKIFPTMFSKPEKIQIFALVIWWFWAFALLPMYMPFLGFGLWEKWEISVWLEICYHILNAVIVLLMLRGYLKEEWFMFIIDWRSHLKQAALTVGLIVGVELVLLGVPFLFGVNIDYMLEAFPVVELSVSHTPLFLLELEPIFGAITLSLFTPFGICALFYCVGFAPVCCKKPWVAYLCIIVITLIPSIIDILWRGDAELVMSAYFANLPVHLIACWSYQKTDNVWTPIISLSVTNLTTSIILPILLFR